MADHRVLVAVLCFALGMVLQACLMLRGRFERGDVLQATKAVLLGAIGMVPGRHEPNYEPLQHVIFSLAACGMAFAYFFRDRLLPRIGGRLLLAWNILLIYVVLRAGWSSQEVLLLILLPTVPTVVNAFSDIDRRFGWKVFFHAWFTVILVVIGVAEYDASTVALFEGARGAAVVHGPLAMIASGGAFLYIVANAWYVLALIPIKGRTQSWSDRMAEIRSHMQLLARGYVWEEDDPLRSLAILIGLPALLTAIALWGPANDRAVIPFAIALMPWAAGPVPEAAADAPVPPPRRRR